MASGASGPSGDREVQWSLAKDFTATIRITDPRHPTAPPRTLKVEIIAKDDQGNLIAPPDTVKVHELAAKLLQPFIEQLQNNPGTAFLDKVQGGKSVDVWPDEFDPDVEFDPEQLIEIHDIRHKPEMTFARPIKASEKIIDEEAQRFAPPIFNTLWSLERSGNDARLPPSLELPADFREELESKKEPGKPWMDAFRKVAESDKLQTKLTPLASRLMEGAAAGTSLKDALEQKRVPQRNKDMVYIQLVAEVLSQEAKEACFSQAKAGSTDPSTITKQQLSSYAKILVGTDAFFRKAPFKDLGDDDQVPQGVVYIFLNVVGNEVAHGIDSQQKEALRQLGLEPYINLMNPNLNYEQTVEALSLARFKTLNHEFSTVKKLWKQLFKGDDANGGGQGGMQFGGRIDRHNRPGRPPATVPDPKWKKALDDLAATLQRTDGTPPTAAELYQVRQMLGNSRITNTLINYRIPLFREMTQRPLGDANPSALFLPGIIGTEKLGNAKHYYTYALDGFDDDPAVFLRQCAQNETLPLLQFEKVLSEWDAQLNAGKLIHLPYLATDARAQTLAMAYLISRGGLTLDEAQAFLTNRGISLGDSFPHALMTKLREYATACVDFTKHYPQESLSSEKTPLIKRIEASDLDAETDPSQPLKPTPLLKKLAEDLENSKHLLTPLGEWSEDERRIIELLLDIGTDGWNQSEKKAKRDELQALLRSEGASRNAALKGVLRVLDVIRPHIAGDKTLSVQVYYLSAMPDRRDGATLDPNWAEVRIRGDTPDPKIEEKIRLGYEIHKLTEEQAQEFTKLMFALRKKTDYKEGVSQWQDAISKRDPSNPHLYTPIGVGSDQHEITEDEVMNLVRIALTIVKISAETKERLKEASEILAKLATAPYAPSDYLSDYRNLEALLSWNHGLIPALLERHSTPELMGMIQAAAKEAGRFEA